jgi:hypothetical protein
MLKKEAAGGGFGAAGGAVAGTLAARRFTSKYVHRLDGKCNTTEGHSPDLPLSRHDAFDDLPSDDPVRWVCYYRRG